jgi:hypothetical protein
MPQPGIHVILAHYLTHAQLALCRQMLLVSHELSNSGVGRAFQINKMPVEPDPQTPGKIRMKAGSRPPSTIL